MDFYIVFSRQTLFYGFKHCLGRRKSVLAVSNIVLRAKTLFEPPKHCLKPWNSVIALGTPLHGSEGCLFASPVPTALLKVL
jgi:hypothetical protein